MWPKSLTFLGAKRPMTTKTFMRKFRTIANRFYWNTKDDDCLRGYLRGSNTGNLYCPITAMLRIEKNKIVQPEDVEEAVEELGLKDHERIVKAADYRIGDGTEIQLRRSLLKTTRPKGAEIEI